MVAVLLRVFVTLVTASTVVTLAKLCECYHKCCGKYCGKVFVCLMLMLTVCSASNSNKHRREGRNCNKGSIWPRTPYYLEGEDLVLICNRRRGSYKNLTFVRGQTASEVPAQYIHRLNDTAIKMVIPNITGEHIDASGSYSTQYKCIHKMKDRCFDNVYVRLEYAVRKPVNLMCWDYDFNEMTCNWSFAVEYHNHKDINVTCEYRNISSTSVKFNTVGSVWEQCPDMTGNSCHWNSSNYPAPVSGIRVKVTVTNIKRNVSKMISSSFNKYDIVEPAPVTNLKGSQKQSHNRCVELEWEPPKQNRCFVFIVTYNSICSSEQEKEFFYFGRKKKFNDSIVICDLVPYILYTFRVKGRVIREDDNGRYVQRGYWSKPKILEMETNKDELDVNPVTIPGLYELANDSRQLPDGHDSLNLYWTPLKDCDLHDASYNVSYSITACNMTTSVSHPAFTAQIDVPTSRVLNVTLQAANSVAPPSSHIDMTIFPAVFGPSPSELIMQYNKTNTDCETSATIEVRENRFNFSDLIHTLVWCKGTHDCQEPVKWKKLETNITSFVLPGNQCDVDYRYGLVTYCYHDDQGQIVDTGIHWEPCIYQLGKEIDKPLDNVRVGETQEGKRFMVEWNQYDCKVMEAYVTHYTVTYCVADDCSCIDKQHVNVSRQHSSYTSDEMSPGSHVCVWVRGVSKMGVGPTNEKPETLTIGEATSYILLVSIACSVVFAALVFVLCYPVRNCYKRIKKITEESRNISVPPYSPESEGNQGDLHDQYYSLLNNETSGIVSGSGFVSNNYSSAGTAVTDVLNTSEGQPLMFYDSDSSGELDGYKQPNDFEAVESGYQEETISKQSSNNSLEVRSDNLKASQKNKEEQKDAESLVNDDIVDSCDFEMKVEPDENGDSAYSQSEAHLDQVNECEDLQCSNKVINTPVNDLVESKHKENFEMKAMTFQGDSHFRSANELESQELDEETELTFDQFINQNESNDVLYKETNSGSTFFDDSDDMKSEIEEFSDSDEADKISMSGNDRSNLQDHVESIGGNVDVSDHSENKSGEANPSGQTSVIPKSAIINQLTVNTKLIEQDSLEEDVKPLNDSKSDFDLSDLSEIDDAEFSDDDTSDIETMDMIVNQFDGSGIGYKRSEDVSGMSASDDDSDSEEVSDESAEQNESPLAEESYGQPGINVEKLENKNHVVNGLVHTNGFISSLPDKLRNRVSSDSDSSMELQSTSHGNSGSSSGVKSYVKADKEHNLQEVDRKHGNNSEGFKAGEKYKNIPYQNGKKIPGIAEDVQSYSHS